MKRFASLPEVQIAIASGSIDCVKLVEYYLHQIEKNNHLNAFIEVYIHEAKARALEVDAKIKDGTAGKLAGMVLGLKDVLSHRGHQLNASSNILKGYTAPYSGTAVQRLLDQDAIIIGRQSCDEFAMGSSNENSAFGSVLNPHDNTRVPGGSSGASAVAVAADMCLASIGSDTGGSVRQPAAFNGVIGIKPTYSRISRYGLIAYASSFDCIGPITSSLEDAALLLEVMAGADEFDSTVSQKPVPEYSKLYKQGSKGKRVAIIKGIADSKGLQPEIRDAYLQAIDRLMQQGHKVEEVDLGFLEILLPTYYVLTTAEASSNLSRFDGIRYGKQSTEVKDLSSLYKATRSEGFGKQVKRRIMLGTFVLSADYYDAYFTKAQRVRRIIKEKTDALLSNYDFLLTPTTPETAFKIGDNQQDPLAMFLADIFTVHANLAGIPSISVPCGKDAKGLPIGLQLSAGAFKEAELLGFAANLL